MSKRHVAGATFGERLCANMTQLNNDGVPGFSANDLLAPALTYIVLSLYADLQAHAHLAGGHFLVADLGPVDVERLLDGVGLGRHLPEQFLIDLFLQVLQVEDLNLAGQEPVYVQFSGPSAKGDRSGGSVSPNARVIGLSRSHGPVIRP